MTLTRIGRRKQRYSLAGALAVFAVVCGLVLLIMGQGVSCGVGARTSKKQALASEVIGALRMAQQIDGALESKNYGEARRRTKRLLAKLTGALNAFQGSAEKMP